MNRTEPTASPESLRILAADLSLRCPGFAVLRYEDGKIFLERLCHLDQRKSKAGHGAMLCAIYDLIVEQSPGIDIFVREQAFSRFPHETQTLSKVVGVADLAAWRQSSAIFHEIAPTTVKKLLTGSGKSEKESVAAALNAFVGDQIYKTDDESDAVAVGIAWLKSQGMSGENSG